MSLNLDNMAIFVAIADAGGFTAAARLLGMPKSTVSRRLSDYEHSLGITLFNRSTRSLSLTEEGRNLYSEAKTVVDAALDLGRSIEERSKSPKGLIRLTTTASIGQCLLAPSLNVFLDLHPGIQIELVLVDRHLNLIEEGIDLAIRLGVLEDSELVARRLTSIKLMIVGSPNLISKTGTPSHPSELAGMDCVVISQGFSTWNFGDGHAVSVNWRLATGTMLLARDAALSGRGFAILPEFMVAKELLEGDLVHVLTKYPIPPVNASIVAPLQRFRSPAVRKLMEHMVEWYGGPFST